MEQPLIAARYDLLNTTITEYNMVLGSDTWYDNENRVGMAISTPGKLKNLRVELNDTPGGGTKTYTFTLRRAVGVGAWGNTALTCTVASGATQTNDMVNEVSVAAGDVVVLECNPANTPTARYAKWSMVFEGDNANESLLLVHTSGSASGIRYCRPAGRARSATENDVRAVCPTGGTIKNLYAQLLDVDPGTAPDAYRFTLRIDGANSQDPSEGNDPLQVTIVANNRVGNDTLHEIPVSAGDILTVMAEPISSPSASPYVALGMTFVADTDGESLILGGSVSNLDNTATEYNRLIPFLDDNWTATEAETYQLAQVCTLKKLYMLLSDSPGAGNKYTFTVRRNDTSPASGLVIEIADAATTGNDTSNTITISNDDELDLMCVPDSTPTVRTAYWGLVSLRLPSAPAGLENKSANMGSKMVAAGLI